MHVAYQPPRKRKHDIVQDMFATCTTRANAPSDAHTVGLQHDSGGVEWVSTMRMMGFTVPSAKTMAQSRADIVNAFIDCDQPTKSAPANVEGHAGVVNPGRPGTASALRLGQSQASKPAASSSMEYAPAADTVLGSVLVASDAGAGTTRTKQHLHKNGPNWPCGRACPSVCGGPWSR